MSSFSVLLNLYDHGVNIDTNSEKTNREHYSGDLFWTNKVILSLNTTNQNKLTVWRKKVIWQNEKIIQCFQDQGQKHHLCNVTCLIPSLRIILKGCGQKLTKIRVLTLKIVILSSYLQASYTSVSLNKLKQSSHSLLRNRYVFRSSFPPHSCVDADILV